MRSLKFALGLFACMGWAGAIVSTRDHLPSSLTTATPLVTSSATGRAGLLAEVTTNTNLDDLKAERKADYVGAASYDYGRYAYPDYKYGGGGGYGGGGVGGYGGYGYDPLKGLLVPLAGVALLGAAALFVSNPVLLQLGVVGGKRRRREAIEDPMASYEKLKEIRTLETFIEQIPQAQVAKQEKKLVANYLKCSSSLGGSRCLERLACEMQKPTSNTTAVEREVLDIVTSEMMKNEYIPKDLKQKIKKAEQLGTEGGKCEKYYCSEVDLI